MTMKNNASMSAGEVARHVIKRAQSPGLEPLNEYELWAIKNAFAWVAEEQNAGMETVQSMTESRFGVEDISVLPREDYDEVIHFLVKLGLNEVKQ